MRLLKAEFVDHPLLGNLSLDFSDENGRASPTVVIAGENGSGKTTVLDALHRLAMFEQGFRFGSIDVELTRDDVAWVSRISTEGLGPPDISSSLQIFAYELRHKPFRSRLTFRMSALAEGRTIRIIGQSDGTAESNGFGSAFMLPSFLLGVDADKSLRAAIGGSYERRHQAVTGGDLDPAIRAAFKAIAIQDATEFLSWARAAEGHEVTMTEDLHSPRLRRFREAFNQFFVGKSLGRVDFGDPVSIMFETQRGPIDLAWLSRGEREIVYRGAFILAYQMSRHGVVLIDEPEAHLHPDWQTRILGYYQRLAGVSETSQLIVATHSPFLVHDQTSAKVIVLEVDPATGFPRVAVDPSYPSAGGRTLVRAFNVERFLQTHESELFLLVEGKTDKSIIETAWAKLHPGRAPFFVIQGLTGASSVAQAITKGQTYDRAVVGLFDFDDAFGWWAKLKYDVQRQVPFQREAGIEAQGLLKRAAGETVWGLLLPVPPHMAGRAQEAFKGRSELSIEFMFRDEHLIPDLKIEEAAPGGVIWKVNDNKKAEFAEHVKTLPRAAFDAFEPLFARLEEVRNKARQIRQAASFAPGMGSRGEPA